MSVDDKGHVTKLELAPVPAERTPSAAAKDASAKEEGAAETPVEEGGAAEAPVEPQTELERVRATPPASLSSLLRFAEPRDYALLSVGGLAVLVSAG